MRPNSETTVFAHDDCRQDTLPSIRFVRSSLPLTLLPQVRIVNVTKGRKTVVARTACSDSSKCEKGVLENV